MQEVLENNEVEKYNSYQDSGIGWMGEIPSHWEIKKLKHIFIDKTRVSNPTLNSGSISFGKVVYKDDEKIPESTKASYQELLSGEFLINPLNLNYDLISLRIGLSDIDVVVSTGYIILKNSVEIDKLYFKYLLHRYDVAYMKLLGSGVRQTINFNHIANSLLAFPPLSEQTRIATFLDKKTSQIDQAIAQKGRLIRLLKERRQIMIHNVVTQGLDSDVKMKDSCIEWIGQIPENWEVKPLRYLGTFLNGISAGADYFGSGFPFINYVDAYKHWVLPNKIEGLAKSSKSDRVQYSIEEGDVLFTRTSEIVEEIGLACFCFNTIDNASFSGFLIRFLPIKNILLKEFSKYYFRSETHRSFFVKEMNIVIRASLSQDLLKRLPVLIPPLNEQVEIARYLDERCGNIDVIIERTEQGIESLKEYKSTLINSAVTGKIKV